MADYRITTCNGKYRIEQFYEERWTAMGFEWFDALSLAQRELKELIDQEKTSAGPWVPVRVRVG